MEIDYIHPDIAGFIEKSDATTRKKIVKLVNLLAIREYHIDSHLSKKIENGLYELRIKSIHNIRIFYTFHKDKIMMLHIIEKKTEKLRTKDLETARKRLRWLQSR